MILRDRVTHCFQNTLHFLTKAVRVISFIELTKFLWLLHDKSHYCVINSKVNNWFIRLSLLIKFLFHFIYSRTVQKRCTRWITILS